MEIARPALTSAIETALARNPVVVLSGPRRCGKTTLARQFLAEDSVNYLDLEDPVGAGSERTSRKYAGWLP